MFNNKNKKSMYSRSTLLSNKILLYTRWMQGRLNHTGVSTWFKCSLSINIYWLCCQNINTIHKNRPLIGPFSIYGNAIFLVRVLIGICSDVMPVTFVLWLMMKLISQIRTIHTHARLFDTILLYCSGLTSAINWSIPSARRFNSNANLTRCSK